MATLLPPPTLEEVQRFLDEVHRKMRAHTGEPGGIIFKQRPERVNEKALLELDITATQRLAYLRALKPADFAELSASTDGQEKGPDRHLWVFIITIKKIPVYVKIQLIGPTCASLCVSFHRSTGALKPLVR